jgi:hypothetical protein
MIVGRFFFIVLALLCSGIQSGLCELPHWQEVLNKSVDLKIYLKKADSAGNIMVGADFIGRKIAEPERIAIEPEAVVFHGSDWQGGFAVELISPSGKHLSFKGPNAEKFFVSGLDGKLRIYQTIKEGKFCSINLPLGEWFNFNEKGSYHLKIHYEIFEDSTRWSGPVVSNELTINKL